MSVWGRVRRWLLHSYTHPEGEAHHAPLPLATLPPLPSPPDHDPIYHTVVNRYTVLAGTAELRARQARAQIDSELESYGPAPGGEQ